MKETQVFETWINNLAEGTWALPETPESRQQLLDLLSKDFPVGADATNATEQLYNILGDDELFDQLQELAAADANADARSLVIARMQELSSRSPDIESVLDQLQLNSSQPSQNVDEADDLSSIEEGQCNMTESGEHCPIHGIQECGVMEYTGNPTHFGLEEDTAILELRRLAHGK
jgi:hypothetical protein